MEHCALYGYETWKQQWKKEEDLSHLKCDAIDELC